MRSIGFAFAAAAAIGNSCIDGSRKFASQRLSVTELIGLVGLLDAVLLVAVAVGSGNCTSFDTVVVVSDISFLRIVVVSAGLKVIAGFLYQRALHLSPLSVTVPYLAFTPVLLVVTSFIMMHEEPSYQGLLGVLVVTIGGYLLALDRPGEAETKKERSKENFWNDFVFVPLKLSSKWRNALIGAKDKSFKLEAQAKWQEQMDKESLKLVTAEPEGQVSVGPSSTAGSQRSHSRIE